MVVGSEQWKSLPTDKKQIYEKQYAGKAEEYKAAMEAFIECKAATEEYKKTLVYKAAKAVMEEHNQRYSEVEYFFEKKNCFRGSIVRDY